VDQFSEAKVETLVSNDPGCILHLRQEVRNRHSTLKVLHLAEFLDRAMHSVRRSISHKS